MTVKFIVVREGSTGTEYLWTRYGRGVMGGAEWGCGDEGMKAQAFRFTTKRAALKEARLHHGARVEEVPQ